MLLVFTFILIRNSYLLTNSRIISGGNETYSMRTTSSYYEQHRIYTASTPARSLPCMFGLKTGEDSKRKRVAGTGEPAQKR